jgi:hypothetical protein
LFDLDKLTACSTTQNPDGYLSWFIYLVFAEVTGKPITERGGKRIDGLSVWVYYAGER